MFTGFDNKNFREKEKEKKREGESFSMKTFDNTCCYCNSKAICRKFTAALIRKEEIAE